MKTVDDYIKKYGFCNWQAQELLKRMQYAEKILVENAKFWQERKESLGSLSKEAETIYDKTCAAIAVLNAD